jgi:hypothetical protein
MMAARTRERGRRQPVKGLDDVRAWKGGVVCLGFKLLIYRSKGLYHPFICKEGVVEMLN